MTDEPLPVRPTPASQTGAHFRAHDDGKEHKLPIDPKDIVGVTTRDEIRKNAQSKIQEFKEKFESLDVLYKAWLKVEAQDDMGINREGEYLDTGGVGVREFLKAFDATKVIYDRYKG